MTNSGELILIYGHYFTGRTLFSIKEYGEKSALVDMRQLLVANPEATLRQLLNQQVMARLLKGENVVLEGCGETISKRSSVAKLLAAKVPDCILSCHVLEPRYGLNQSLWLLECHLAERALKYTELSNQENRRWDKVVDVIENWSEHSDPVTKDEGFRMQNTLLPIRIQTFWKFDIPALFIERTSLLKTPSSPDDISVVAGVDTAIEAWYRANPCGRVIIVHDYSPKRGVSASEREIEIKSGLKQITAKVTGCPIYLLHTHKPVLASRFCQPPGSGLIAFLHRLHHLHLNSQGTVYWYATANHMKMAESAGIKHIKASRVFAHPKLASSNAGAFIPQAVDMLTTIEYISPLRGWYPKSENQELDLPLVSDALETSGSSIVEKDIATGRKLYLAFSSHAMLESYIDLTRQNIRLINDVGGNKIAALCAARKPVSSSASKPQQQYELAAEDRELPEWMQSRRKTPKRGTSGDGDLGQRSSGSLQREDSGGRSKGSSTVYIMSEKELIETARRVLLEAGEALPTQEEIIEYRQKQQQSSEQAAIMSPNKSKIAKLSTPHISPTRIDDDLPPGGECRKIPPARRRINKDDSVLDELFDFSSPEKRSPPKTPTQPSNSCLVADTQVYNAPDENTFAVPHPVQERSSDESRRTSNGSPIKSVPDSLVLNSSSSAKSNTTSSKSLSVNKSGGSSIKTIPDSLVPESSSSTKSSAQRRSGSDVISDSLVLDSKSTNDTFRSNSRPSVSTSHLSDSLVTGTKSTKSSSSKGSYSSAQTRPIPDSLVPNTSPELSSTSKSINRHSTSPKYVSDSFVSNTSSSKGEGQSSRSQITSTSSGHNRKSNSGSSLQRVSDSLVEETPSSSEQFASRSQRKQSKLGGNGLQVVDDSFVGSTTVISESLDVFDNELQKDDAVGETKQSSSRSKSDDCNVDMSFLDDLI